MAVVVVSDLGEALAVAAVVLEAEGAARGGTVARGAGAVLPGNKTLVVSE